jgi:TetR/AcrR family transcriptional regulator, repressor for uid operon
MRTANPELRQQRRDHILLAAGRCFVDKGFHQTSMAEIAAASGLSMGLLYRYFRSKDELVLAFAEQDRAESIAALTALGEAGALQVGLGNYLDTVLDGILDPAYLRTAAEILAESSRNPAMLARLQHEDRLTIAAARAALQKLTNRGLIAKRLPISHLATLFAATLDGLATRALLDPALDRKMLKSILLKQWLLLLGPE